MKIVVTGSCQVRTIAECLRVLMPHDEIDDVWVQSNNSARQEAVRDSIEDFDVVISHDLKSGPLESSLIKKRAKKFIYIPPFAFNGAQPDNIVIGSLVGAFGLNHSAIVITCFLLGLSERRCEKLFNAFVYASFGYFERFELDKRRLLDWARNWKVPLDDHFDKWPVPFMFDIFHPHLDPLASIAEVLLRQLTEQRPPAGWTSKVTPKFDEKSFLIWPVYPEIALRLGVEPKPIAFSQRHPKGRPLELSEFIKRSYSYYREANESILSKAVARELPIMRRLLDIKSSSAETAAPAT